MKLAEILIAFYTGVFLSLMVGPVLLMLIQTSATKGVRAAIAFNIGACTADIIFIIISVCFSYKFLQTIKNEPKLYIAGGAVMALYGVFSFITAAKGSQDGTSMDLGRKNIAALFTKGFLINIVNVGVFGFWLMVVLLVGPKMDMDKGKIFYFFIIVFASYMLADLPKILLAKKLKSRLTTGRIIVMKKITGLFLFVFGTALIVQTWFPSDHTLVRSVLLQIGLG
ncbi:LysE family translocator [Flavobacterium sp. FlaQc-48]|uniref:LysE family translocator n=1 Tax=Flavobacterium sp. FlaQc-48 TaxID=3374181 RepID=UPI003756B948